MSRGGPEILADNFMGEGLIMLVSRAVESYMAYHRTNSKPNTLKGFGYTLDRFTGRFGGVEMSSVSDGEVFGFLVDMTEGLKQNTKSSRAAVLRAFFNFTADTVDPSLANPENRPMIRKVFKRPRKSPPKLFDKEVVDELIYRAVKPRDRLLLELMGRAGMRVGEVLKLRVPDVGDRKLTLRNPKSGRRSEVVFIPQKVESRLRDYVRDEGFVGDDLIFPFSYTTARRVVKSAGDLVGIHLRPHDLRRHAATQASRSGVPLEIVSKVILRHADISTTERYLGEVSDAEANRWIEHLHGY